MSDKSLVLGCPICGRFVNVERWEAEHPDCVETMTFKETYELRHQFERDVLGSFPMSSEGGR